MGLSNIVMDNNKNMSLKDFTKKLFSIKNLCDDNAITNEFDRRV